MNGPVDPHGAGPAYGLAHKAERAAWQCAWLLLARWTPPPLFAWRAWLLRVFGARIGANVRIHASARIWRPRNLACEDGVLIGPGAIIYNQGRIAIGRGSVVSQRAHLCAGTHDVHDRHFAHVERPIRLGAGCWVAAEAFVGPGVEMEDGAVLGARGALFEDAQAMTIYRGNPAMPIGARRL